MLPLRVSLTAVLVISVLVSLSAAQRSSFSDDASVRSATVRFLAAVDAYLSRGWAVTESDLETLCLPEDFAWGRSAPLAYDSMRGEGHIFSPEVARIFRRRVADTLRWQEHQHQHTLAVLNHEELTAPPLIVGEFVPPGASDTTFEWLTESLPVLPIELEYRRVARDLVLVDRRTGMVVDVLRAAIPMY